MTMTVVNPATGETIQSYAELTAAEVTSAITVLSRGIPHGCRGASLMVGLPGRS